MTDEEYYDAIETAGHQLYRDENGEVDYFAMENGYHNGPMCIHCGESWCHHCRDYIFPCTAMIDGISMAVTASDQNHIEAKVTP